MIFGSFFILGILSTLTFYSFFFPELCILNYFRTVKPKKIFSGKYMDLYLSDVSLELILPYFDSGISAGFPSPALDFKEEGIDLNKLLIKHPSATFLARANGDSLKKVGIFDGDLMIIDRAEEAHNNRLVVVYIDGDFTAKRIRIIDNALWLFPENDDYEPILVDENSNVVTFGVIRYSVRDHL